MYGAGIPILFPLALLSFMVLYFIEKLLLAYSYQHPPMFDEKLNRLSLKIMAFAPVLYFTFGFWMFNNLQIFTNTVYPIKELCDNIVTGHNLASAFRFDTSFPLFFLFLTTMAAVLLVKYKRDMVEIVMDLDLVK